LSDRISFVNLFESSLNPIFTQPLLFWISDFWALSVS
jgi:hypothetical protein